MTLYHQITYTLTEVPDDGACFRRSNPLPYVIDHTILDAGEGAGHFLGCYMAWA